MKQMKIKSNNFLKYNKIKLKRKINKIINNFHKYQIIQTS